MLALSNTSTKLRVPAAASFVATRERTVPPPQ
jgi:hypothetical protein